MEHHPRITAEVLGSLLALAHKGAIEQFGIDLIGLSNAAGESPPLGALLLFAPFGAETDEEKEFVNDCEKVWIESKLKEVSSELSIRNDEFKDNTE